MKCDIHIYIERYNNDNGNWELTKGKSPYYEFYEDTLNDILKDDKATMKAIFDGRILKYRTILKELEMVPRWLPEERNYNAFSYIANVRNLYGLPYYRNGQDSDFAFEYILSEDLYEILEQSDYLHSFVCYRDVEINNLVESLEDLEGHSAYSEIKEYIHSHFVEPLQKLKQIKDTKYRFMIFFDG